MPYSVTKPFAAMPALLLADRGRPGPRRPGAGGLAGDDRAHHDAADPQPPRRSRRARRGSARARRSSTGTACVPALAAQEPAWEPGTASGESALFYGHLARRGRAPGRRPDAGAVPPRRGLRPARSRLPHRARRRRARPRRRPDRLRETIDPAGRHPPSTSGRSATPTGAIDPAFVNSDAWRRAEVPAVNGHGTARAVAGLYVALQQGDAAEPRHSSPRWSAARGRTGPRHGRRARVGTRRRRRRPDGYGMGGLGGSFGVVERGRAVRLRLGHRVPRRTSGGDRLENAVRRPSTSRPSEVDALEPLLAGQATARREARPRRAHVTVDRAR